MARQAWKNGRALGRYRAQYLYVCQRGHQVEPYALPAAAAIDWALPGQRIGDRVKPLSAKTLARIEAGLRRYAGAAMTFEAHGNTYVRVGPDGRPVYARAWPVDLPTATLTTSQTRALVVPVEGRDGKHAQPTTTPLRTQTARLESALVVPYYGAADTARPAAAPLGALTTRDRYARLVPSGGTWNDTAHPVSDSLPTRTASAAECVAFIAQLKGQTSRPWRVDEPLSTVAASGNHHMLVRHNTARGNPAQMCTPASQPARTITTTGHQSLISLARQVEDATFRMLEPHELQAAMAFTTNYTVTGTRRERVRQLGNGVTPPAAEFLLRAIAASLDTGSADGEGR